jgi:hypothetical protein
MARDDFLDNVRDAMTLTAPVLEANGDSARSVNSARLSRRATIWLTPKAVEGYDPNDFQTLDAERRKKLDTSVHAFEKMAQRVAPDVPVTDEQIHAGWEKFQAVVSVLRAVVCDEWIEDVAGLVEQAESWCRARGWIAKKRTKQLHDKFLGDYEASQLHFHTLDHHFLLDPIARYVAGASGLLDLSVLPVCESFIVTRANGKWSIRPFQGEGHRRKWSERAFVEAVETLSSRA